jgi:hypothetical protein
MGHNKHMTRRRRTPDPDTLLKEQEVVKLRRGGLTWDLIAERVGYKYPAAAQQAYMRAAARVVQDDIETIRRVEAERLDIAQSAIWGGVLSGNLPAVQTLIKIQERRARLLGLDQPTRIQAEVMTYDPDDVRATLATIIANASGADRGEALPLEAHAGETGPAATGE